MAAILFHEPIFATDVAVGDKLYFYQVGTTTDLTVYADAGLSAAHTQPVVADAAGRFPAIYFDPSAANPKVVLKDASDVEQWTVDEYPVENTASISANLSQAQLDIEALEGDMATAQSDIDTLQTESADYQSRLAVLEGEEAVDLGLRGDGVRVRKTGSQSVNDSGGHITFQTVDFDDSSMGGTGADPITVPAGVSRVIVSAGLIGAMANDAGFSAIITKNGATSYSGKAEFTRNTRFSPEGCNATLTTGVMNVSPGDTFGLYASTFGSNTLSVDSGTWLNMVVMK